MKPSKETQYTAWIDGVLSPDEMARFETTLFGDKTEDIEAAQAIQAIHQDRKAAKELGNLLRAHLKVPAMKNAEFFTQEILREIADQAPPLAPQRPQQQPQQAALIPWRTIGKLFFATAACAAVSLLFFVALASPQGKPEVDYYAQFQNPKAGDSGISVATFHSKAENITVLWLDGLDYVPATPKGGGGRK